MAETNPARDAQWAAERDADVGREHVGRVWAEAAMAAADTAGQRDAFLEAFDALVHEVLDAQPDFGRLLDSGLISREEKIGILDRVLGGRTPDVLVNFLKVVARHDRLDCLRVIHRQAHVLDDERRGRVAVRLTTPMAVSKKLAAQIADNLRAMVGGEPAVTFETDPALIGGAVLRIGDTVYDGSIATQLDNARKQMIDRSVHEIQSRRDRFRYPSGD